MIHDEEGILEVDDVALVSTAADASYQALPRSRSYLRPWSAEPSSITVASPRCPGVFTRSTQKPLSSLSIGACGPRNLTKIGADDRPPEHRHSAQRVQWEDWQITMPGDLRHQNGVLDEHALIRNS